MSHITSFSGSYQPDDVQFLLKPIAMEMTPVDLKEELIQSGKMHYSDMLSQPAGIWIFSPVRWTRGQHGWRGRSLSLAVNWPYAPVMTPWFWSVWSEPVSLLV